MKLDRAGNAPLGCSELMERSGVVAGWSDFTGLNCASFARLGEVRAIGTLLGSASVTGWLLEVLAFAYTVAGAKLARLAGEGISSATGNAGSGSFKAAGCTSRIAKSSLLVSRSGQLSLGTVSLRLSPFILSHSRLLLLSTNQASFSIALFSALLSLALIGGVKSSSGSGPIRAHRFSHSADSIPDS